ncbi:ribosomal protein S5 domain 2-like protein [Schizopora paradoxa]|uniref:Ribosomal protein S5 domain 2-like protein n=1 Tax=Schizopora paradoxa TaxID=27342 RepID=A0A0H2RD09_9AGAM|nr:ribosomal protein S5 domain 2-like protein [Schizopora paradoxa]
MRPPSPSIPEREFALSALQQSMRIDGRTLLEIRPINLTFGPALGCVECELGKTRVLAFIDSKMIKPPEERPLEGIISIHSEISPMASSAYETGRPSDEEVAITRMLEKVLRRSDAVDRESLCIVAGQRVWHLRLTLHFLADAGNMLDCACLAAVAALRHFRRPEVEVVGEDVITYDPSERPPIPLAMHHTPYVLTFALFPFASTPAPQQTKLSSTHVPTPQLANSSITAVLDPSPLEASLLPSSSPSLLSLALTPQRELCVVNKAGGVPVSPEEFLWLVKVAEERVREVEACLEGGLLKAKAEAEGIGSL